MSLDVDQKLFDTIESVITASKNLGALVELNYIVVHSDSARSLNDFNSKIKSSNIRELSIYYSPANGVYSAMNFALSNIEIEKGYVWFVNAGDSICEESSVRLGGLLSCAPDIVRGQSVYEDGDVFWTYPSKKKIHNIRHFSHQALIIRSAMLRQGFDSKFSISADKESYYFALSQAQTIFTVIEPLARMEVGGISQNGKQELLKFKEDCLIDIKYRRLEYSILVLRLLKLIYKYFGSRMLPGKLYTSILQFFVK